ncbi:MAG: hypothetical protein HC838_17035 [Spirulinaceae cyanobacterium RM2_2_10]|nr:hypothetical protein [Spirulinaceae cyanobacterium RM2_2_10]
MPASTDALQSPQPVVASSLPLTPPVPEQADLGELTLPTPSSNLRRLEALSQELWELRLVCLSDGDYHGQQLQHLRRRWAWLLVGCVAAIATATTALIWTGWRLQSAQVELTRYAITLETQQQRLEQLEQERLMQLEAELRSLQTELPESLPNQLATQKQEVADLQRDVQSLEANLANHRDAIAPSSMHCKIVLPQPSAVRG